jgi:hypothetical protein
MDFLLESIDFKFNLRTFDLMKDLVSPNSSVVELCCRSGFFGVYLAGSRPDIRYIGIDIHPIAIGNAKGLASANGLNPDVFLCMDYSSYNSMPDTIIGRNLTNTGDYGIDFQAIERITRMAENIIVLHFAYERSLVSELMNLNSSYEKKGFAFNQVSDFIESEALFHGVKCFVYNARHLDKR